MPAFRDKVVIVTGASEGIGRAVCKRLAKEGAMLALAARNKERLEQLKEEVEGLGGKALVVPTDVSDPAQCKTLVERTVAEWGRIDALLNNAGITLWTRFEDIEDLSIFEKIIKINYLGAVNCTYYALPELKKTRGLIAATASGAGLFPVTTHTAYCGSKHAMFGFFDSLRAELAGSGVQVTMIAPGFVETEIHKRALDRSGKPLGDSPVVDKSIYLSADKAAEIIVRGMEKRKRLVVTDWRIHLARWAYLAFPRFVEKTMAKTFHDAAGGRTF